jgi:glycosyltransferase involved in cell wall biosynthesis
MADPLAEIVRMARAPRVEAALIEGFRAPLRLLERVLTAWRPPGSSRPAREAEALQAKLWGGFSVHALEDLERLKVSANSEEAHGAAWALARWHRDKLDYQRAYDNLVFMTRLRRKKTIKQVLLEAECLTQIGQAESARALLNKVLQQRSANSRLYLAMANCYTSQGRGGDFENDAIRLGWLNQLYQREGLEPLIKGDQALPLAIDNLVGSTPAAATASERKVTILMPTYQAENTLPFALRSVLAQTWRNLEVIVIDDSSSDDSFSIANEFAGRDSRVSVVRQERNQGAYVARNRGLELATGEYLTVHDADDWSHPQRIEIQMRHALSVPNFVGNLVRRAHVGENLRFMGPDFIAWSRCSLLMPTQTAQSLGGWDRVRISADVEFISRLERSVGEGRIERLLSRVPMLLQLTEGPSLTRSRATSWRTGHHGIRREYREAAQHWHESVQSARCLVLNIDNRPFPVPGVMRPTREARINADLLFIADFNLTNSDLEFTLSYAKAAADCGRNIALFHWRHYQLDVTAPLQRDVRQLAQENKVRIIAPGESVRASTVIVGTPTVLYHVIDLCPQMEFDTFVVLVTDSLSDGSGRLRNPQPIMDNINRLFRTQGIWIPSSERLRRLMLADSRYPAPHSDNLE